MKTEESSIPLPTQTPVPDERRGEGTDRRRVERRASTDDHARVVLSALLEISNYVGSVMVLDEILAKIVEVTARIMKGQSCSVYLLNEDRSRLVMRCNLGLEPELVGSAAFEIGHGIPGTVAKEGQIVALADGAVDPHYDPLPSMLNHDFHAYLCAPLRIQSEVIGVMVLRKREVYDFLADEITIYETICKQVSIVIEKAKLYTARMEAEKLAAVAVSLSGVAHYIKNLLVSMRGGEYLVETGLKREDMKMAVEGWGVLKRSNSKIRELVENMLNYYRDSALHPRPTDLNALILELLQNLEDRAIDHNTTLIPDLDLRLEKVELDHDAIQDVMINLITNAMDAIPQGRRGTVRVQSRLLHEREQVRIVVQDNGHGIKPEDKQKIFGLFYSTKGKKGTGIGLAATRRLVADHHGTIEVQSQPDDGTEFVIHLPLSQPKV